MPEHPSNMHAWTHTSTGLPTSVLGLSTLPRPTGVAENTHILIRISHCALNPGASIIMQLLPFCFRSPIAVPEMDFSGTVLECGDEVPSERGLKRGTKVFGSIPIAQHIKTSCGALSEVVSMDHTAVVAMPENARLDEVAGLGIAGATALELMKKAGLKKGDAVLVNGASGGIGHLVVQMCRNEVGETGRVVAICSDAHARWVKELGCDEVIDYKKNAPISKYLEERFAASRFNAVIDAAGIQNIFTHCPAFLAEGKPYVTVGPRAQNYTVSGMLATIGLMAQNMLWPRWLGGVPRNYNQVTGISNLKALRQLADMVEKRSLKVHIGFTAEMEDAEKAYDEMLNRHAGGKILVKAQDITN